MSDFLLQTDFYKVDHRRQYPDNTRMVYSNYTPRASRIPDQKHTVAFGLQYFLQWFFGEEFTKWLVTPRQQIADDYQRMLDDGLGPNSIGVEHVKELWDLGRMPLRFFALPEGATAPLRVPHFAFCNTHPDFAWVVNYFETVMSSAIWQMVTSATTAHSYRKLLDVYAALTGGDPAFVPWQGHDFSFRGMAGPEAAARSGAGHLLSFTGTDTIPAIQLLRKYYHGEGLIGGSVAATEHSVMCAGGETTELETFDRLLNLYPSGIVSVVSDTWDLWQVIEQILPKLKDKIMAREGKLVIRPDSGDPVKIICGDAGAIGPARKGVIELLWEHFGGTFNKGGFRQLDSHIGAIYGDSITLERADAIGNRLYAKRFASTNVVLGIGSYTYQYVTRDTYGQAIKATAAVVGGEERMLFKDPKTDDGVKKSARGCLRVFREASGYVLQDGLTFEDAHGPGSTNCLEEVWRDGVFIRRHSLGEIRRRLEMSNV